MSILGLLTLEEYLTERQINFCNDTVTKGSLFEKHILNWVLENLVPIRMMVLRPDWLYISYEYCLSAPEKTIKKLNSFLNIGGVNEMLKQHNFPSSSVRNLSTPEIRQKIKDSNSLEIISRWQNVVTHEEKDSCSKILNQFEIELYNSESPFPITNGLK